ncbi:MAG: SDR family oxidoreductase, partial [Nevskia sp.]|nr:SDR family oxidoreductase [Nevskia sp.]
RHMLAPGRANRGGTLVFVTSCSAEMVSTNRIEYCISKAGLSMAVAGFAARLADQGISVFEIRPGIIRTDMTSAVTAKYDSVIAGGLVPARRWGEGRDIANAVRALARGDLGFATGSVLKLDGGLAISRL